MRLINDPRRNCKMHFNGISAYVSNLIYVISVSKN